MFDTVRLRTMGITIEQEQLLAHDAVRSSTKIDEDTGEIKCYVQLKSTRIPYLLYSEAGRMLVIELSTPKFLFGENVTILKKQDMQEFFTQLRQELYSLIGMSIANSDWVALRTDVCWNFNVGNKVQDYLKQLSLCKLPRMRTLAINQAETVIFENKSKRIMLYDKERECRVQNFPKDVTARAKGVLRLEINPSDHEMKKYSESRKAVDLLTKEFFEYVTRKVSTFVFDFSDVEDVSFEFVKAHSAKKVEVGLGFQKLLGLFGIGGLKKLYKPSTLDHRRAMLKKLNMETKLPPLEIDYKQL
jgi:hypothetical protein